MLSLANLLNSILPQLIQNFRPVQIETVTGDNLDVVKMIEFVYNGVENIMRKG